MKFSKPLFTYFLLFIVTLWSNTVLAQCAMCKASAESDLKAGGSIATGLNSGILYLMAIPYLILSIGAYFFFKKQIDAKLIKLKNKYFPAKRVSRD